jgi:hypothetical protein
VAGPAIALLVTGILCIVAYAGLGMASLSAEMAAARGDHNPERTVAYRMGGMLGVFLVVGWWAIIICAALQMKALRNHGFAMTGAILALIPCNLAWVFGLPFGIWALVVLSKPEIKSAFR